MEAKLPREEKAQEVPSDSVCLLSRDFVYADSVQANTNDPLDPGMELMRKERDDFRYRPVRTWPPPWA